MKGGQFEPIYRLEWLHGESFWGGIISTYDTGVLRIFLIYRHITYNLQTYRLLEERHYLQRAWTSQVEWRRVLMRFRQRSMPRALAPLRSTSLPHVNLNSVNLSAFLLCIYWVGGLCLKPAGTGTETETGTRTETGKYIYVVSLSPPAQLTLVLHVTISSLTDTAFIIT